MDELDSERLGVRAMTVADARVIATWRYSGPWSVYDGTDDPADTDPVDHWTVVDEVDGNIVGFYCTGVEARVPGLDEKPETLDLGIGMRPNLVGVGNGPAFASVVVGHCRGWSDANVVRAVVQSWNERSMRLAAGLGLSPVGTHSCVQGERNVEYVVLEGRLGFPTPAES